MGLSLHCTRATDPREMGRLGWSGLGWSGVMEVRCQGWGKTYCFEEKGRARRGQGQKEGHKRGKKRAPS